MNAITIDRRTDALLVVDIQNDFCTGGALAVPGGEMIIPAVNALMKRFETVVLTQDWHPAGHLSFASSHPQAVPFAQIEVAYGSQTLWPDHCVQGTPGADFHPSLHTVPARLIVRKGMTPRLDSYSGFYENDRTTPTGLGPAIRDLGVRRVFLSGLATDFCVLYTALDARRLGFEVGLVRDTTRGIDLDGSVEAALEDMRAAGVIEVTSDDLF